MTELEPNKVCEDKAIRNYLVVYKFKNRLANIAFHDMIKSNFNGQCIYCNNENPQSLYLSIPLNRENILSKLKHLITPINKYFEDSDYLYIVSRLSVSLIDSKEEQDIILGHEIINEQNKTWADIVSMYKL